MATAPLPERNQAEVDRSASQAGKFVLKPLNKAEIGRYINPPPDTPYSLEYAFHLLGDVRGKNILDLGCGTGENVVVLRERGARVIGIDISPHLIAIARKRIRDANVEATLAVGDAYNTGFPAESFDVIFSIALIHHLDIKVVRAEMLRILRHDGRVILSEPIRFSKFYAGARSLLPNREHISDFEHPLSRQELATMTEAFKVEGIRYFRLPFVPLVCRLLHSKGKATLKASNWIIQHWPMAKNYASVAVMRLQK